MDERDEVLREQVAALLEGGQAHLPAEARQFLLIGDHNGYHLGQLVLTRKLLGDRPEGS